jgi:CubicO group peptidase (beta-lactamase class C family)
MMQRDVMLAEGFDKLVAKTMEMWNVPGLAIGVVDNGSKEYKACSY